MPSVSRVCEGTHHEPLSWKPAHTAYGATDESMRWCSLRDRERVVSQAWPASRDS
jgi:hypothetical protein